MPTALLLVAFGVLCRLGQHYLMLANYPIMTYIGVPMGAIALFAAARLPRTWALAVPIMILAIPDVIIDRHHAFEFSILTRATTYVFYLAVVAVGFLPARDARLPIRFGMAIGSATLFFLISNLVVWATGGGYVRPQTLSGLMMTYADGLPFYRGWLVADVLGVAALFGVVDLLTAPAKANRPAEVTVE